MLQAVLSIRKPGQPDLQVADQGPGLVGGWLLVSSATAAISSTVAATITAAVSSAVAATALIAAVATTAFAVFLDGCGCRCRFAVGGFVAGNLAGSLAFAGCCYRGICFLGWNGRAHTRDRRSGSRAGGYGSAGDGECGTILVQHALGDAWDVEYIA